MRILVVDDDPGYQDLLPRILAPLGTQIVTAGTLADAFRIMAEVPPPDFIFLDLRLPDSPQATMTLAAVPQLRQFNPLAPIVVLTGDPDEKLQQVATAVGVEAYRLKDNMDAQKYLWRAMLEARDAQIAKGVHPSEATEKINLKVCQLLAPTQR